MSEEETKAMRDSVIEECARSAEQYGIDANSLDGWRDEPSDGGNSRFIAARIRKLKTDQPEEKPMTEADWGKCFSFTLPLAEGVFKQKEDIALEYLK